MTIRTKFFLMLLFLSLLMAVGNIVPGYLKLREFELDEATAYALDRSIRMKAQIKQSIDVLEKAGVADIDTYINESKEKVIDDYNAAPLDPRVNQFILDQDGGILFNGGSRFPMPITPSLIRQLSTQETNKIQHIVGTRKWLLATQKHDEWGWHLLSGMSEKEIYKDSQDYLMHVMAISGLVLLFVICLYILLTRQLNRKTKIIMNHLAMYKAGRYDKRFQVTGSDELSVLQNSINAMIDSIEIEIESRKSAEKELIRLSKIQIDEEGRAEASLLKSTSFSVINSVSAILGFSDLLRRSELNQTQASYASNISEASEYLNRLMKRISGQSDNIPGNSDFNEAEIDIPALCKSLKNLEVLLVDDDALNKQYIAEVLSQCNIRCTAVDDFKQAVTHLDNDDADLILLNMSLSSTDSEKTITHVRENLQSYMSSIPLIALTTNATPKQIDKHKALGATATIPKPFSASRLLLTIKQLVDTQ